MAEKEFTQRSLARAWAERADGPDDFETARRAIRRYLGGMTPIERTRVSLAGAIGCKETGPAQDVDKEED